jgi:acetylornithine/N-succinyldiaminopimelate aminotransferase
MTTTHLMPNYARQPVVFTKGSGVYLWDSNGEKYLDALSGVAVCALGHAHPELSAAIADQAATLIHTSNIYGIDLQSQLADKLASLSGMDTAFFCNSGAEANEAAIKLARYWGNSLRGAAPPQAIENPKIIVMEGSFHGRTMGALSATGNTKIQKGFEPLLQGFIRVPYNNIEEIQALANDKSIVAMLVEPVQGEGGVNIPSTGYLQKLREICNQNNWLLMLDEVQTGIGRTGKWFAFQHDSIMPDVVCLAKGLGGGVPIGACLAAGKVSQIFQAGTHGSTFGGNPLACRAALTVIDVIEKQGICEHTAQMGKRFLSGFQAALQDISSVKEIRAKGLMVGIELDRPCGELVKLALKEHLLINVTADKTIRLLPPLIINETQVDEIIQILSALIRKFLSE